MAGEQTIDELNIRINTEAKQSSSGMDKLISSIERLKTVTGGGVGELTGIAASLATLSKNLANMKGASGSVSSLANSINKLNDARTDRISASIKTLTDSLKTLGGMDPTLKTMISDLAALSRSGNGGTAMNALKLQAQAAKTQATIDQSTLKSAKAEQGLQAIADKNAKIEESAKWAADAQNSLADAVARAAKTGYSGELSDRIPKSVAPDYGPGVAPLPTNVPSEINAASINSLKAAMGEFGGTASTTMNTVSSGSSRAASFMDRLKQSVSSAKDKLASLGTTSNSLFSMGRFYGWYFILRQIANTFGGFINNINSYIENQNLFAVAMGTSAQEGRKLADSLQSVLGVDSGEAMRYMGVFAQLTTSFGIANKQAMLMSENMTQLGYDIASFYNISTEKAFQKLQSGITGQVRAIRELGIDTSNARLQQELYNLGIKEKVRDLTEADKAELRYIAIMKQTTNAQGDMARTILTPANALRVLQAQLQITGRAIGSIFIPALLAILPPVTAVVEVIGELASEIASFFGFKMPKIDYSSLTDLTNSADDATDSLGDVGKGVGDVGKKAKDSKKELDNLISGFDELHILQTDNNDSDAGAGSGTGAAGGAGGNILGGIDLPSYNALSDAISNNIDALKKKIRDFIDAFREDPLKTFADALWGVNGAFGGLGKWLSMLDYADILNGIAAAIMAYGLTKNPILALAIGAIATAISHFLPQKSKIDLLNGSLIALGGALVLKQFTGMPFKLALGISALLESGLVELLGTDNAINLLTSALTGLGAGMLAFSFTNNLPLAVAIGAVSAAISGLAIHFSDMQIAPSLLAGVTAGLLAFKLGLTDWTAGAVGIGVALATFAELNDLSPELSAGLLGLSGAVTGLGLAFQAGFGPQGMIIAAVAGAFIGLAAGIKQAQDAAVKADLARRFGEISLSASEVEDIAKRLTTTPWTIKIDAAIDAKSKLADLETNIKNDIETLNKMNWEVSVGLKLSKSEMSTYKETINSFVSDAKAYVQQQHYAVSLAIDAVLEPGSATAKNLTAFTTKYYSDTQAELDKLGTQLSNEVNKAFADNVLSEGEVIKIQEIQKKMNDLLQKIADQKYQATLKSLELDTKSTEITADSFKDLQSKIQSNIQEEIKQASQNKITVIEQIEAQYQYNKEHNVENADKIYQQSLADVQESFNNKKATLELSGLEISLNTVNSKFSSELKSAQPVWSSGVQEAMSTGWKVGIDNSKGTYTTSISGLVNAVSGTYQKELNDMERSGKISTSARKNIESLVTSLEPTETDLKQIASSATVAGKAVPTNVAKGISDIEQLKAIGGNIDAIHYMVGKKFSTDPTFLNTLATAKDAGKNVDKSTAQGIIDNIQFATDASGKTIIGIRDTVTGKTIEITPTLKKNLQDLGINMSNSLVTGTENKKAGKTTSELAGAKMGTDTAAGAKSKENDLKKQMGDIGANSAAALSSSAQKKIQDDEPLWKKMFGWLPQWAKDVLGIHSPSTVFSDMGDNIVKGLWEGIYGATDWLKRKIKSFAEGIIDTFKDKFHIHSPSQVFADVIGKNLALGIGKGFTDNMQAVSKLMAQSVPTAFDYRFTSTVSASPTSGSEGYSESYANPAVVAPQSTASGTVEEPDESVATVLAQILEVAQKISEKDTTLQVDSKTVAKTVNKVNSNQGFNLGLQST
jgi:hypothetical protein